MRPNSNYLNAEFSKADASTVLKAVLHKNRLGKLALVSSFGAESAVLLHMVAQIDPQIPVLFIDTEFLFPETIDYLNTLAEQLGLQNIHRIRPNSKDIMRFDPKRELHKHDKDNCCHLRKILPLELALRDFDGWINGRKRYQTQSRHGLELFEHDTESGKIKLNPLYNWDIAMIRDYMKLHALPPHPLVARRYPSIGCMPCTSPVGEGEDPRIGRWRDSDKEECGIHFVNGKIVQVPASQEENIGNIVISDQGFHSVSTPLDYGQGENHWVEPDDDPDMIVLDNLKTISVHFPSFSDGRGFGIARVLRRRGFKGKLRAVSYIIADQYAMARRVGFNEVEISPELATRQNAQNWQFRSDWNAFDYQSRLGVRR